jgi:solute:Na+ symporter, SSS family
MSLLLLARNTFPAWFLGVIGGAGALTAMVPSAIILLTASTLMAKNVVRPLFAPQMSDQNVAKLAKGAVLLLSLTSLYLALHSSSTLVALLLIGYAGVTQFFPGVILGLFWPRATAIGVLAGLIVGTGMAAFLIFGKHDPLVGLNGGFLALIANTVVVVLISLITPVKELESSEVFAGEV